ncbi:pyridine nucleotide-disulfide oxidoreductase [Leptolyngbya sp. BL0902]|uniref:NAD(P)/FAD-dependent oxidoreductase n=1 Tax=Leptolyngbya sp. BL0902 TaxID=1115757 RepID=UPI0018E7FF0E|nr:FAD/NAD(P)-binding oxidoreductase [Leptolyngbya sp. BL0902]QQE64835.1 pyridine nucleotide-disulfide oxidoreductase [Leptolyngbya sp. BL0902]
MTTSSNLVSSLAANLDSDGPRQTLRHHIVVIGGGAAGITVTAQLLQHNPDLDIAIIEPSAQHHYQPGWTLVGGGVFRLEDTTRDEQTLIPKGSTWIQDAVVKLDPDHNTVLTQDGQHIQYEFLVVCPGIQIDWHKVKGLPEALGKNGVTSNYRRDLTLYTRQLIQEEFTGGTAVFTYPNTPIKCGGAPQKIMYMADDAFKQRSGVGVNSRVLFCTAGGSMFGVKAYSDSLDKVVARRGIEPHFHHNLVEIRADAKEAVFEVTQGGETVQRVIPYAMIHVVPPMSAPDFIKNSPLAVPNNPGGWVDVDKDTLRHHRYPNVFSLGDASSLPTSKTAAAVRGEAPVLVANLLAAIQQQPPQQTYDGYTCCPLITGYNSTIMAEFDYQNRPRSSFLINPTKERWSMWLVKKHLLPRLYWERMLKGKPFEGERLKPLQGVIGYKG